MNYTPSQMSYKEQRTKEILSDNKNQKQPNWPTRGVHAAASCTGVLLFSSRLGNSSYCVFPFSSPAVRSFYCRGPVLSPSLCAGPVGKVGFPSAPYRLHPQLMERTAILRRCCPEAGAGSTELPSGKGYVSSNLACPSPKSVTRP